MNRFFLRILSVLALLLPLTANAAPVDEYPNAPSRPSVGVFRRLTDGCAGAYLCHACRKYFGQPIVILNSRCRAA